MAELHCFGVFFFFFNDTATTEIYTLSLHDALPICTARSTTASCCSPRTMTPRPTSCCAWPGTPRLNSGSLRRPRRERHPGRPGNPVGRGVHRGRAGRLRRELGLDERGQGQLGDAGLPGRLRPRRRGCWTAWSRSMPTLAWLSSVYVPRVVRDRVAEDRGAQADARRVDAVLGWQP